MLKRTLTILLLSSLITSVSGTSYHVTVNGKPNGNGTLANPWDLNTALNKSAVIKGGDTLWIHPGTYSGVYKSTLQGNAQSPIIVKAVSDFGVILDGNVSKNDAVLSIEGKYVYYCGLIITNSGQNHIVSASSPVYSKDGVYFIGAYNKLINCIIHNNTGDGIGFWNPAIDAEIYGCIIYHNGYRGTDRGHGHGIYTQNTTGTKLITDNIFFNSYGIGIHIYTENGSIKGFKIEGNAFCNSGLPGANELERHIIAGGLQTADNITVTDNYFYNRPNYPAKAGVQFGYSAANQNAVFTNNYMVGGTFYCIKNWNSVKFTGNSIISRTPQMQLIAFDNFANIKTPTFNNNHYYKGTLATRTFDEWKRVSNQDANSRYYASEPAETVCFVRKNRYEKGRANLIVYNWKNTTNVAVDMSGVLSAGDTYQIYDVFCLSNGPVQTGVYDGKSISVSMALTKIDLPDGYPPDSRRFSHTAPLFGMFIVKSQSGNPASTEWIASEKHPLHIQSVYPNPVTDKMTITFDVPDATLVQLNIFDMSGKSVHYKKWQAEHGIHNYIFNCSHLEKGVYIISLSDGLHQSTAKFVKQ
jgi:hypothetical protein